MAFIMGIMETEINKNYFSLKNLYLYNQTKFMMS